MKKIGYIYKYSPSEGMGILVFGTWKKNSSWHSIIKNTPILFSKTDLLSDVSTGQLVYFDLNKNTASSIERASLSNFKVDYINSLIRCKENESEYSFYYDNTIISFERLDNIIFPNEENQKQVRRNTYDNEDFFSSDYCFDDLDILGVDSHNTNNSFNATSIADIDSVNKLPKTIVELFNCFGKYKHKDRKESKSVNVFDLLLWVDSEVFNADYYGKKVDEIKYLYDIFVLEKHYDRKGKEIDNKIDNDYISPMWSSLLSKFSENDLREIIWVAPKLQPALPVYFCKKNVGILTDDYGMPNVEICKLYCLNKISNAVTVSDYKKLKQKLYIYRHCNAKHLEDEGTPMCKMGKIRIGYLEKRLEEQYENIIKKNVITQLSKLCEDATIVKELNNATQAEFNNVGIFIENCNNLRSNFLGYDVYEEVLDGYERLPQLYKDALKTTLINCVNEAAISATQLDELSPFILSYHIEKFGNWVLDSTKQQIKELVNDRFSKLDDLEELSYAYKAGYITGKQYYYRYKQITSNFNTYQFLRELYDYKINDAPMVIQWYVVSNIIKQLGYKDLNSHKYVKVEYLDPIYDIRSLLKWLADYGHLKDIVLKKTEEKICSVLSNGEKWTLFEGKLIQSPGIENIRRRLDQAYYKKSADIKLLSSPCFQDVMLSDVDSIKDSDVLLFIADNLDEKHQYLMKQKATGFLKLYLWQKQPTDKYDWNLIKTYYHELSAEAQIRTLRYIFGVISSGDCSFSLDDLYSEFVETTKPACSAICGILYILKEKKNDINASITSSMVESVIGEGKKQLIDFLKGSSDIFYPCNGYLAISGNKQDVEYQTFYGILTKEVKNDELFYVVHFYGSPVDIFGRTIDWLVDSEYVEIAKQVLLKNTFVEVISDKYYIHESHEFFVKQFVIAYDIDDRCGLVSDKEWMIEQGYLPRNNAYQPLYTNYRGQYEYSDNYICRCGSFGASDPQNNIPFFWCKKKMCVRRAHFLLPPSEWRKYRFADLLFIVLGQSPDVRESVWRVNSEISQFICDYKQAFNSNERIIFSKPLNEIDERGVWDETSSIYRDIYDYDEGDEYDEYYDDNLSDYEEPTYEKYNGSYAQDEMGYSDDDIDTIFDGDPDAYWNID